jgi:Uncharacterized protein affecting Mg2+/Co2+ transport
VKNHINITVSTEYLDAQSNPEKDQFAFAYYVTLTNEGEQAAQLISRHWIITDGNGVKKEVRGLGVVGEQPVLEPGMSYQYNSFSVLETSVGTMEGSYQMQAADDSLFDAIISPFLLSVPGAVN